MNVQRVFASTGRSSNDINLSSFLPKSFANPFQQIEETQGYAYPASNGLTEIDRYINKIISESFSKALFTASIIKIYLQIWTIILVLFAKNGLLYSRFLIIYYHPYT